MPIRGFRPFQAPRGANISVWWNAEVLGAHEVRRGHVLPGDVYGWLDEGRRGLPGEACQRLLHGGLIAVLGKLASDVCVDADGAVVAWIHPRRALRADDVGQSLWRQVAAAARVDPAASPSSTPT